MLGGWHGWQMPPRFKESCLGVGALESFVDQVGPESRCEERGEARE